jgi:FAD/FMN-containing dehydrogenase
MQTLPIDELRAQARGQVISTEDEGYEDARRVYNAMIDRSPAVIVRAANAGDVMAGVNFARERGLDLAVRGGGHSVPGFGTCDGGVVIDLSGMRGVRVDPSTSTAWSEGGATWGDFNAATHAFGLATTGGIISTTGVAGLTLGGGIGYLARGFGLSIDNLVSADVVTADGQFVQASEREHDDLFWALRGGGGSFGVATAFEYRLHPVDTVLLGSWLHPAERVPALLELYREHCGTAPNELTLMVYFLPTSPEIRPPAVQGEAALALTAVHSGDVGVGERLMEPLGAFGPPLDGSITPMRYATLQSLFDSAAPPGLGIYMKSCYLRALNAEAIETITQHVSRISSPLSHVLITQQGGAANRVDPDATAFGHRKARHIVEIISKWKVGEPWEHHREWVQRFWADLQPHSIGEYVNFLEDEGPGPMRSAFRPATAERLLRLKADLDPQNVFSRNHLGQLVLGQGLDEAGKEG